jgi:hypothetical protein
MCNSAAADGGDVVGVRMMIEVRAQQLILLTPLLLAVLAAT